MATSRLAWRLVRYTLGITLFSAFVVAGAVFDMGWAENVAKVLIWATTPLMWFVMAVLLLGYFLAEEVDGDRLRPIHRLVHETLGPAWLRRVDLLIDYVLVGIMAADGWMITAVVYLITYTMLFHAWNVWVKWFAENPDWDMTTEERTAKQMVEMIKNVKQAAKDVVAKMEAEGIPMKPRPMGTATVVED